MHMHHIVICGLSGYATFFHIISQMTQFSEKGYWTRNVCFDFLHNICLKQFPSKEEMSKVWSKMNTGLHVKYALFLLDFNET